MAGWKLLWVGVGLLALTVSSDAAWVGKASYYKLGGRTANGGRVGAFTAAHPFLPFGSRVRVTNLRSRRATIVTITDRGPHGGGRIIDLSAHAARALGFSRAGVARVKVEVLGVEAKR